jgi:hypothetical protein
VSPTPLLQCSDTACPLAVDGTCIDGFDDPSDCPNSNPRFDGLESSVAVEEPVVEGVTTDDATPVIPESDPVLYIGGDEALSLTEAEEVTARALSRVVLVAGEYASGKTTLVVELWAQFLQGPFGEWSFKGSKTLAALDKRHRPARVASGRARASTDRTQDDDMRLLHLELSTSDRTANLLMSDVKGEFFDDLINGVSVGVTVPLARRADACIFMLDGARLVDPADRAATLWRSQLLIGALTEPDGLAQGTPILLAVSKCDLLDASGLESILNDVAELEAFAQRRGTRTQVLSLSARPGDARLGTVGLEELLDWSTRDDPAADEAVGALDTQTGRYFWRGRLPL